MTDAQKLHALARQLCMDRFEHWKSIYEPIGRSGGDRRWLMWTTKEAYEIYPRYRVDEAVLEEIEHLDPDNLPEFDDLRQLIINAALTGASSFTRRIWNRVHNRAMAEERRWLAARFQGLTPADVKEQHALPYRRVLGAIETKAIQRRLRELWGAEDPWYPLVAKTHPSLVSYDLGEVDEDAFKEKIRGFLEQAKIARLFAIRADGPSYEIDADANELVWESEGAFWTDAGFEWVVYLSYQETVTFYGTVTFGGTIAERVRPAFRGAISDPSAAPQM